MSTLDTTVRADATAAAALDAVRRLVGIPSVSGQERPAVEEFVRIADALGLVGSIDPAGNALALRPSRTPERARIVLLGHIDTVPGHIPTRVEAGVLYGRGSVDAKGPLAAMLAAAARAVVPDGVTLEVIGAVGEETARSPGARFVRDHRQPAACIIGEPSGWDGITLGYKGRLRIALDVSRPNSHSAGPLGSACDVATQWWNEALAIVASLNAGHEGAFDTIHGSLHSLHSTDDGLVQHAGLTGGFRLPPWIIPSELERRLPSPATMPGLALSVQTDGHETAHAVGRNDPVARALSEAIRLTGGRPRPKLKTGTSDLNVVAPVWKCPIVAYGPGDSSLDHTPDERLDLSEYLQAITVLKIALARLGEEVVAEGFAQSPEPALG